MHSTHRHISGNACIVLGVMFVLTLFAPLGVIANSHAQTEAGAQEAVFVCLESYSPALGLQPSVKNFSTAAEQHVPEILPNLSPRSEKTLSVELQVPEVLLQTLLREEMLHGSTKQQAPQAVLTILFAEGNVHRLSRDQGQCHYSPPLWTFLRSRTR
jgi:hypothetical protein